MQLDEEGKRDDDSGPRRASCDRGNRDGDEQSQTDMGDERPSRRHADGAESGDVGEKESIEGHVQSERADESEEHPRPGQSQWFPFARNKGHDSQKERERSWK